MEFNFVMIYHVYRVEFRSVLGHYNPQEIIYIKGGLTSPTEHILNTQLCQGCRKVERQVKQFWSSDETVIQFINGKYFVPDQSSDDSPPPPPENTTYPYFPSTLIEFLTNNQHLAVSALGGCMGYLKDMKAEKAHLSFKSISLYESESSQFIFFFLFFFSSPVSNFLIYMLYQYEYE